MKYLTAILLPPLAVLRCRRTQTAVNVLLTLCFYVPGALHAALVVYDHQEQERARSVGDSIRAWQMRTSVR
jgi:uncharacterized membrane protein YqaE (UPF0057 family)